MDAGLAAGPPGPVRKVAGPALIALLLFAAAPSAPGKAPGPSFDTHWHDGKAELDGYRLTIERYGHARQGRAVAIYVTEPFSRSRHVKLDDPSRTPGDVVDVLKLNLVRDFQTGIYFARLECAGQVRCRRLSRIRE